MLKQPKILTLLSVLAMMPPLVSHAQTCDITIPATTPTAQFTDNGDGTVTDTVTGLTWKRCSEGQTWTGTTCTGNVSIYNWQGALNRAKTVNSSGGYAGKNDWRVPNINELRSIVERKCSTPAINLTVFPNTPFADPTDEFLASADVFWSSSPTDLFSDNDQKSAWIIYFNDGNESFLLKNGHDGNFAVRLVRGGL
jgi:hypothetical protein